VSRQRIVAVAVLTEENLQRMGSTLATVFPVENEPQLEDLLSAIDEADRRLSPGHSWSSLIGAD
jgi:hypothetical protein